LRAAVAIDLLGDVNAEDNLDRKVGIRFDSIKQGRKEIDIKEGRSESPESERRLMGYLTPQCFQRVPSDCSSFPDK